MLKIESPARRSGSLLQRPGQKEVKEERDERIALALDCAILLSWTLGLYLRPGG